MEHRSPDVGNARICWLSSVRAVVTVIVYGVGVAENPHDVVRSDGPTQVLAARFPHDVVEALDQLAGEAGCNRTEFLRRAVRQAIASHNVQTITQLRTPPATRGPAEVIPFRLTRGAA